jgi:hypothetical protein
LSSPPVWTPKGVIEVFNWTLTPGTLVGICGWIVTVELFPNCTQKFHYEGLTFVVKDIDCPSVAVPIDA